MLKLISFLHKRSSARFALSVFLSLIGGLNTAALIILIIRVLNDPGLATGRTLALFVALCLSFVVLRTTGRVLLTDLTLNAAAFLRHRLAAQVLQTPLARLEQVGTAHTLTTLTEDVSTIAASLDGLTKIVTNAAIVIACLTYVGTLSVTALAVTLAVMILGVPIYIVLVRRGIGFFARARMASDRMFGSFQDLVLGIKELKANARRRVDFMSGDLPAQNLELTRLARSGFLNFAVAISFGQMLFFSAIGIMMFGMTTPDAESFGVMTAYSIAIIYMITPLEAIMNSMTDLGRAQVAFERVESCRHELGTGSEEIAAPTKPVLEASWAPLRLSGVTYTYQRKSGLQDFHLGPVELELNPNEIVFLTGGNGSGKTSLAKILTGLYRPDAGEVYLGETHVTDANNGWYREHFSTVFSDCHLFERIPTASRSGEDVDLIRLYLASLGLADVLSIKDGVLSTVTELSLGQRKRLALLQALLEDRPIYVLDEWAAEQDPAFRETFYRELLPSLKARGKSVVAISHDDRYFDAADRILRLDYGVLNAQTEALTGRMRNGTPAGSGGPGR